MVIIPFNPSHSGGRGRRISSSRTGQAKLVRPYLKNKIKTKRAGGITQVVQHRPSKCKALSSIFSIANRTF
jgi:hypothetical protein